MTFTKNIRTLSFVLAASVSSLALAQGLTTNVGAGTQIGVGSVAVPAVPAIPAVPAVPASGQAGVQAEASTNIGSNTAADAASNNRLESSAGGATAESAKAGMNAGLHTDSAAAANVRDAAALAAKSKHARIPANKKLELEAKAKAKAEK
jgi:hypothetical protein